MINEKIQINGTISLASSLSGSLASVGVMGAEITVPESTGGIPYEGDYTVTPKAHEATILATNGKIMTDDVTVVEIPYYETSNISGSTVYIANEV